MPAELAAAAPEIPPRDPPTSEQHAAISARDRDTFCEAGAGQREDPGPRRSLLRGAR